ncbi:hypothetical protein LINPERPRIM_LOCUS5814 [Linum perenne]
MMTLDLRLPHYRGLSHESSASNGDQIEVQTERESSKQVGAGF